MQYEVYQKHNCQLIPAAETERILNSLRQKVQVVLRRYGGVVGISGGVDSAVVFALSVRAFGAKRVIPVIMPDKDSDPLSERLARQLAAPFASSRCWRM